MAFSFSGACYRPSLAWHLLIFVRCSTITSHPPLTILFFILASKVIFTCFSRQTTSLGFMYLSSSLFHRSRTSKCCVGMLTLDFGPCMFCMNTVRSHSPCWLLTIKMFSSSPRWFLSLLGFCYNLGNRSYPDFKHPL